MGHSTAGGALRATERIQHANQPQGKTQHAYRYPSGGTVLKGALLLGATGAAVIAHRLLRPAGPVGATSTSGSASLGDTKLGHLGQLGQPRTEPPLTTAHQPPPDALRLARSLAPAYYRAIVASDGEAVEAVETEALELTPPQSELLAQLQQGGAETVSSAYATLSRSSEAPGSSAVFR